MTTKKTTKPLFKHKRKCLSCGDEFPQGSPELITITPLMYAHTSEGQKLKNGKGMVICRACFALAMATPKSKQARDVSSVLSERLLGVYNAITGDSE